MPLNSFRWVIGFIAVLSGCTSISGTSSLNSRPPVPASIVNIRYIQNSFRATNPHTPGIAYSPVALLERDGYYDLGNEIRVIAPEIASARGIEVVVSTSDADVRRNNPAINVDATSYAPVVNRKELVLFVTGGQSTQNSADVQFVFHAIFRDASPGIEYWHADYRVKVSTLTPWDPAFDGDTVRKLIARVFDDLKADGLVLGAPPQVSTEPLRQPKSAQFQSATSGQEPDISADRIPYIDARGQEGYREWLTYGEHRAFAISADGSWGASSDKPELSGSANAAAERALYLCRLTAKEPCGLYAIDHQVIWRDQSDAETPR
jgi:hypothetical protein